MKYKFFEKESLQEKKQLILLINPLPNSDMGHRLALFLKHVLKRGVSMKAQNYAFMITNDNGMLHISDAKNFLVESINGSFKNPAHYNQFKAQFEGFQKSLQLLEEHDVGSFDEMIIIGAGVPNRNKKSYSSINGLRSKKFEELTNLLQSTTQNYLKENGVVRIQICHSATIPFFQNKTLPELLQYTSKNIVVSAPEAYSIISDNNGRAIDIDILGQKNFLIFAAAFKKFLNNIRSDILIQKINEFIDQKKAEGMNFDGILHQITLIEPSMGNSVIQSQNEKISEFLEDKENNEQSLNGSTPNKGIL